MKMQPHRTPILEVQRLPQPKRRHTATRAEADAMDREAIRIVDEMRSNWLRLGLLLRKMIDARAYAVLGYPSMHAWMNARLGQSMAAAFSAMRSVSALHGVSVERLKQ